MFSTVHIAITAGITALICSGGVALLQRHSLNGIDSVIVGLAAGIGILLWRLGANTVGLNTDPIPGVSPADVLCAPMAYVAVGIAAGLRGTGKSERFAFYQSLVALVALAVNIITI